MNQKIKRALSIFLREPKAVLKNGIRSQMNDYDKSIVKSTYGIERLPSVLLTDMIGEDEISIYPYTFLSGTSIPTDMALLKYLAGRKETAYLELGSWRGESIATVGEVTDDLTSINLSEEQMSEYGYPPESVAAHDFFTRDDKRINKILADSQTFDYESLDKKFDLIFVDADHSYEGVLRDTQKVYPLLRDQDSVLVWHDYAYYPEDVRYSVLRAILDGIPREKHQFLYHVYPTMSAIYWESNPYPTVMLTSDRRPKSAFQVSLQGRRV